MLNGRDQTLDASWTLLGRHPPTPGEARKANCVHYRNPEGQPQTAVSPAKAAAVKAEIEQSIASVSPRPVKASKKPTTTTRKAQVAKATSTRKVDPKAEAKALAGGEYRKAGMAWRPISVKLNGAGITTPTGGTWYGTSLRKSALDRGAGAAPAK